MTRLPAASDWRIPVPVAGKIRELAPPDGPCGLGVPVRLRPVDFVHLPHFDTIAHEARRASGPANAIVQRIDAWFAQLVEQMRRRDALVLVTADHGFVDSFTGPARCRLVW